MSLPVLKKKEKEKEKRIGYFNSRCSNFQGIKIYLKK